MEELSLVFFTVLAQGAAGLCLALCGMKLFDQGKSFDSIIKKGMIFVLILILFASIASMTHLGQPFRAINVLNGLAHGSALSLEIISLIGFVFTTLLFLFLLLKKHSLTNNSILLIISALTGLLMIYAMSKAYTMSTVNVWFNNYTPLQFFMTALLLGFVLLSYFVASLPNTNVSKYVQIASVIIVALYLTSLPLMLNYYGSQEIVSQSSIEPIWTNIRLITLGLGILFWFIPQFTKTQEFVKKGYLYIAITLLFCSELAGRIYFYDLLNLRIL